MSTESASPPKKKSVLLRALGIMAGLLILAVGGILAAASMQPDEFRVTRSITVSAAPAVVFPHYNDLHRWDAWSPWAKKDPQAKVTFAGPETGVGSSFAWDGNAEVGAGKMTIIESRADQLVKLTLEFFKPMTGESTVELTLTPKENGTEIVWTMYGPNQFMGKVMSLFMDCDAMVGGDFEVGLSNLKMLVDTQPAPPAGE
jgi:hypothetical protein